MRWTIVLSTCALATIASAQVGGPRLPAQDVVVLTDEHHADQRAMALARLAAERGSEPVRTLGRHILRDAGFADQQVLALARARGADLLSPPDAWDRMAADERDRLARLDGLAFDREVVQELADELGRHLDRIDVVRAGPHDGQVLTLVATMRPMLARYQAETGWIARGLRPSS